MNRTLLVVVTLAGAVTGPGFMCRGEPSPSSQTCADASLGGTVTEVAIGRFVDGTFTAYQDGDVAPLTYGGQGFPMLVLNLRVRGSGLGTCIPQTTRILGAGGTVEGSEELPLTARMVLPDTWITGDAFVVSFDLYGGDLVELEATVGGVTRRTAVWIDYMGTVRDGGQAPDAVSWPDAAAPDAGAWPDAALAPDATP